MLISDKQMIAFRAGIVSLIHNTGLDIRWDLTFFISQMLTCYSFHY